MDISSTIEPKSDQLDAAELTEPRTFTIDRVSKGNAKQPVNLHLVELGGRAWRPSKNVRRVLVAAWGKDASKYVGRRARLYCDPTVRFGKEAVGGVRIEALSHIDRPVTTAVIESRGRSKMVTVQPLIEQAPTAPPAVSDEQIAAATTVDELRALWAGADEIQQQAIKARVAEIEGGQA
ncbi:hypothetical protein FYJ24_07035 [Actinomycetaceae bacterium WB03_NA08]|uniref:Uncharacterized protein n=1 Tax=Scrofimicrobium canadense TaxID=2652290 RepID=A0A6N7W7W5_9ACTO|nr:hypothetical protein [Scrofimicrobium canadense]MSS84522.1 hypothetical protein [Scrofimicrobium canadense]